MRLRIYTLYPKTSKLFVVAELYTEPTELAERERTGLDPARLVGVFTMTSLLRSIQPPPISVKTKATCAFLASAVAVSAATTLRSSDESCSCSSEKESFWARIDGLRFIETLVTAHR